MTNYTLRTNTPQPPLKEGEPRQPQAASAWKAFLSMVTFMKDEQKSLWSAFFAVIVNSGLNLVGPLMIGYAVDRYVQTKQFHGIIVIGTVLLAVYLVAFFANYTQIKIMGGVGQRILFKVRNALFTTIQDLPISFFNQNKAGDLISRINSDTEKLNTLFSQTLVQFTSNFFIIVGAGIFILFINFKLALVALAPALGIVIFTRVISPWLKKLNLKTLQETGSMSGEIQESLANFKVVIAFNRRDYFRNKFESVNAKSFAASIRSGLLNGALTPAFDFFGNIAQLAVLAYGIFLIMHSAMPLGLLISFLIYINRFYDPLRQFAALWASFQTALASWDRISEILNLKSDLLVIPAPAPEHAHALLEFRSVTFGYPNRDAVLENVSFTMEAGKTYALVGPTGGGKTTTASLIARLFDPLSGTVFLNGKDIRSYEPVERTKHIGFILQEPFVLSGTVIDNIVYGNDDLSNISREGLEKMMKETGLDTLLMRFEDGLDTKLSGDGETMSLGQRQLLAFIRAVLRKPDLLILDEATANIDTVTEQLLDQVLEKLPKTTTRVIIAHRLNTIENADEIFFVNGGTVTPAGSMEHAVEMLLHGKRSS